MAFLPDPQIEVTDAQKARIVAAFDGDLTNYRNFIKHCLKRAVLEHELHVYDESAAPNDRVAQLQQIATELEAALPEIPSTPTPPGP
jgi:hypothetical protein